MVPVHQRVMHMHRYRHDLFALLLPYFTEGYFWAAVREGKAPGMGKAGKAEPGQGRVMDHVLAGHGRHRAGAFLYALHLRAGLRFNPAVVLTVIPMGKTKGLIRAVDGGGGVYLVIDPYLALVDAVAEGRGMIGCCQRAMQVVQEKGGIHSFGALVGHSAVYIHAHAKEGLFKAAEEVKV